MSEEKGQELWAKFLAGAELSGEEERELLAALRSDSNLRDQALADHHLHGLLRARERTRKDEEAFERAFFRTLGTERDATRFIKKVETRLEEHAAAAKVTPGHPRRPMRRPGETARGGRGRPFLFPALAAAGVLFGIVLLYSLSASGPDLPEPGRSEAARRERERAEHARNQARPEAARSEEERTQARADRERLERDLAAAEETKRRLAEAKGRTEDAEKQAELRAKEEVLEREAQAFRTRLQEAREKERRAAKKVETPSDPAPGKAGTRAAVAKVERAEDARQGAGEARAPLAAGQEIVAGGTVETGAKGSMVAVYADGTRLEFGPDTAAREFKGEGGKRLYVEKGTIVATVTKQPKDQPMVAATPHGEAVVLGTTFALAVDPRATRLEVTEGRVRFKGLDGKTVEVPGRHSAVAAPGSELTVRPFPKTILSEDFENPKAIPARWEALSGGFPVSVAGRLEIDLSPRRAEAYVGGWGRVGGLQSRQAFPLPLRLTVDVELTQSHEDLLPNIVFTPVTRDDKASYRIDRRALGAGLVGLLDTNSVMLRSAEVPCRWPGRERWTIEVEGDRVGVWIDQRQVLDHRHGLKVHAAYFVMLEANAKSSVPQGSAVRFDNVRVEYLPR